MGCGEGGGGTAEVASKWPSSRRDRPGECSHRYCYQSAPPVVTSTVRATRSESDVSSTESTYSCSHDVSNKRAICSVPRGVNR